MCRSIWCTNETDHFLWNVWELMRSDTPFNKNDCCIIWQAWLYDTSLVQGDGASRITNSLQPVSWIHMDVCFAYILKSRKTYSAKVVYCYYFKYDLVLHITYNKLTALLCRLRKIDIHKVEGNTPMQALWAEIVWKGMDYFLFHDVETSGSKKKKHDVFQAIFNRWVWRGDVSISRSPFRYPLFE